MTRSRKGLGHRPRTDPQPLVLQPEPREGAMEGKIKKLKRELIRVDRMIEALECADESSARKPS